MKFFPIFDTCLGPLLEKNLKAEPKGSFLNWRANDILKNFTNFEFMN